MKTLFPFEVLKRDNDSYIRTETVCCQWVQFILIWKKFAIIYLKNGNHCIKINELEIEFSDHAAGCLRLSKNKEDSDFLFMNDVVIFIHLFNRVFILESIFLGDSISGRLPLRFSLPDRLTVDDIVYPRFAIKRYLYYDNFCIQGLGIDSIEVVSRAPDSVMSWPNELLLDKIPIKIKNIMAVPGESCKFILQIHVAPEVGDSYFDLFIERIAGLRDLRNAASPYEYYYLLMDTGYLGKYDSLSLKTCLHHFSNVLDHETHSRRLLKTMVSTSGAGLVASSSVTRAGSTSQGNIWVFHQLCAKKGLDLFDNTGWIYLWRVLYIIFNSCLIGNQDGYILIWYSSRAKWVARIFTKLSVDYCMDSVEDVFLYEIEMESGTQMNVSSHVFEETDEYILFFYPNHLNVTNLTNMIILKKYDSDVFLRSIYRARELGCSHFFITSRTPVLLDTKGINLCKESDRLCTINTRDLHKLIAVIMESVAAVKAKYSNAVVI